MNKIRQMIEEVSKNIGGSEFFQEHDEDFEFLESSIPTSDILALETSVELALEAEFCPGLIIRHLIYESMLVYRDYLIQKDIDVRALEGR